MSDENLSLLGEMATVDAVIEVPVTSEMQQNPIGFALRIERERRGLSLLEVSRISRVPLKSLECLEDGRFDDLPGDVFSRGFLRSYARVLQVDATPLVEAFDHLRGAAPEMPLPVVSPVDIQGRAPNRRFGVAIAFIVLLLLVTIALSIVLKPRGGDLPVELSSLLLHSLRPLLA
jgi:cytoskeletal protein RodZ